MRSKPAETDAVAGEAWKGYALALIAAVSWATGGVTAKWLLGTDGIVPAGWVVPSPGILVDATVLSGVRALVSAILVLGYLGLRRRELLRIEPKALPFLAVFGIAALGFLHLAYYQAIAYSNVATAILLEYLAPILVLVFSVLFLGEAMTWRLPAAVVMSVVGCALVVGAVGGGLVISTAGIAWGLTAAVLFALYQLLGKWASTRHSPWTLLAYGLGFASLFWLVYLGGPAAVLEPMLTPAGAAAVLYLSLLGTVVPFAASLKALHYIGATRAVLTSTLEPVIAGLLAWALFAEVFGSVQLLGGALVIAAIVLVQTSPEGRVAAVEQRIPPST